MIITITEATVKGRFNFYISLHENKVSSQDLGIALPELIKRVIEATSPDTIPNEK